MVTNEKARHNLLRPEALEAMFVLWRTTRNPVYKDWAWQMFQAFQTHCRVRHPLPRQALMKCRQTGLLPCESRILSDAQKHSWDMHAVMQGLQNSTERHLSW